MITDLTEAEAEAYARANGNNVTLLALEIRHSDFPEPVRIIDGNINREFTLPIDAPLNGGELVMFDGVKVDAPEETLDDEPDSQLRVSVGGVSGAVHQYLGVASRSFEAAQVSQYRVCVNVKEQLVVSVKRQAEIELRSHNLSMTTTTLSCGFTDTSNRELQV